MPAVVDQDPVPDILAVGGSEVYKLFAFHDDLSVAQLLERAPEYLPAGLAANHLGADAIDIGPKTIDKCAGLRWVCEQLGVEAADVIAFGDEWNDITMLEWAGRGVAMANADSRVQRAGNEITASNADDGVAVVLEELLA
jgi:hydroxymethylpyrimidine pyrophosphatase-like HAD family hydrolase